MKLFFIQGATRLKHDNAGNWYSDGNFDRSAWERYTQLCDELTVVLRKEDRIYDFDEAKKKFNIIDNPKIKLVPVDDLYRPKKRSLSHKIRKNVCDTIEREIRQCDKAIIRSVVNFYTQYALKICLKYNIPYAIEVTGVAWDGMWYHSALGKLMAYPTEMKVKKAVSKSPYVLYVTDKELQERYPSIGKTVGCSNVALEKTDNDVLNARIQHIKTPKQTVVLGTIGGYEMKAKGQHLVLHALAKLKEQGITNIRYELVGGGNPDRIKKIVKKLSLEDQVVFVGSLPHDKVFKWLDKIDVYVQPSYQEGLCRSVIEAMSRGCPVVCSDACGERELANESFIFKRGDWKRLSEIIVQITSSEDIMLSESKRGFEKSGDYEKTKLDARRKNFYNGFVSDKF